MNRLLSKRMPNIYLEAAVKKRCHIQNFDFLSLKSLSPVIFGGAPTHAHIIEFSKFLLQLKNQTVYGFSIIFI